MYHKPRPCTTWPTPWKNPRYVELHDAVAIRPSEALVLHYTDLRFRHLRSPHQPTAAIHITPTLPTLRKDTKPRSLHLRKKVRNLLKAVVKSVPMTTLINPRMSSSATKPPITQRRTLKMTPTTTSGVEDRIGLSDLRQGTEHLRSFSGPRSRSHPADEVHANPLVPRSSLRVA